MLNTDYSAVKRINNLKLLALVIKNNKRDNLQTITFKVMTFKSIRQNKTNLLERAPEEPR